MRLTTWTMAAVLLCMANAAEAARWDRLKNDGCVDWGKRQYSARLLDTRGDWGTECRNTPVTIAGRTYRGAQTRCDNHGLGGMWGVWQVDDPSCAARWDTPKKDGCLEEGYRQWSAILRDIPANHDWKRACQRTRITIEGVDRGAPAALRRSRHRRHVE